MSRLIIKNGRVIDPASGLDDVRDLLLDQGVIQAVEGKIETDGAETYDASGKIVAPGFIDLRTRLREPGLEHAETIESGSRAAAAGGFSAICCLPHTHPVNDSATVTSFLIERARRTAAVDVLPIGALTHGCLGEQLAEIGSMKHAGVVAVGDGDRTLMDSGLMRRAMRYAASFGLTVIAHCEDVRLSANGDIDEGAKSARLGLTGSPASAELVGIARDVILSQDTGARLHVAHLSTAGGVELVRQAHRQGAPVTAEVGAQHIALSVDDVPDYDSNFKVRPPFRTAADIAALIEGLADGTISAIASDHAPHTGAVKMQELENTPFGTTGLETAVALAIEHLLHADRLPLVRLIELFTSGPAGVLGVDRGSLAVGAAANITILDLERTWTFTAEDSLSKSKNSPFLGHSFRGGPAATIVRGRVVWDSDSGLR
jgi:dihydroorotase